MAMQQLKAVVGHLWSWASDVLGRKDINNKTLGLVMLEIVPSLQMRDFSLLVHLGRAFQGHRANC